MSDGKGEHMREGEEKQASLFDVFAAGHRVSHAGAREALHVLHDDKRLLL